MDRRLPSTPIQNKSLFTAYRSLRIDATPSLSRISSFLIQSLLVWQHVQRNIRILAILIFRMYYPFVA
jgi:hypothetical protein